MTLHIVDDIVNPFLSLADLISIEVCPKSLARAIAQFGVYRDTYNAIGALEYATPEQCEAAMQAIMHAIELDYVALMDSEAAQFGYPASALPKGLIYVGSRPAYSVSTHARIEQGARVSSLTQKLMSAHKLLAVFANRMDLDLSVSNRSRNSQVDRWAQTMNVKITRNTIVEHLNAAAKVVTK